jgi:hypothetical protein
MKSVKGLVLVVMVYIVIEGGSEKRFMFDENIDQSVTYSGLFARF